MLIKVIKGFRMKSVSEELYYGNPTDQANPAIYDSQNCDDIMYQTQMPSDFL
jgi:hypothetical protein